MTPELLRLIVASVCLHAAMTGTRLAAPLLALKQGQSAAAVGVLLALFALTQVFLALPAGRFTDRRGLKHPVAIAVVTAAIGALLAAAFPVFPVLCAAALLTGGASGIAMIALQRHVGRAARNPTQLKQVFSWLGIAPAVSNFVGPFAAGLLIDHAGAQAADLNGFRAAFIAMALLPLACWLLVRGARELPVTQPAPGVKLRARDLLAAPMLRRLLFVNWLQMTLNASSFAMPMLFGVIGSALGVASVFWVVGGAVALGIGTVRGLHVR